MSDAITELRKTDNAVRLRDVPDREGWYAVYVDDAGAAELTDAARTEVRPGLLYVGEARRQTLHRHVVRHTNIGQHTLRRSLASVLARRLRLRRASANVLDQGSKERLAHWMDSHLRIVTVPLPTDLDITTAVVELDPQMNLTRVGPSPLRAKTTAARRMFAGPQAFDG